MRWPVWIAVGGLLLSGCDGTVSRSALEAAARQPSPAPEAAAEEAAGPPKIESPWRSLYEDGLHDPANPALPLLQEPREALSELPPGIEGNQVDWAAALRHGLIEPRTNIMPETKVNRLDLDVILEDTAGMPMVRFPHLQHTEWLDCSNCHDKIFVAERGANPINMLAILQGEFCGQCHGAVSFPLTQCLRCHSVPRPDTPQPSDS